MSVINKIKELIKENNGYITTAILDKNKISRNYLQFLMEKKLIVKIDRGIYVDINTADDDYYVFQLKYKKCVFSGISAMFLQKITNVLYHKTEVNFSTNYNTSKIDKKIKCHRIIDWKLNLGVEKVKTMFGNYVKTYNKERIICDLILDINKYDPELCQTTIELYKDSKPNFKRLLKYAKIFNIVEKVKSLFNL